jgi:hypothetical protein
MVEEYPELARMTTKALWEDFQVSRKEYCDIHIAWQELGKKTGHNKRKLLRVLITTDPDPWGSENATGVKAQIRGEEPVPFPGPIMGEPSEAKEKDDGS